MFLCGIIDLTLIVCSYSHSQSLFYGPGEHLTDYEEFKTCLNADFLVVFKNKHKSNL